MLEELASLPIWGEFGIMTILLSVVVWFIQRILTGKLVPKSTLDEMRETRDTFKEAWESEVSRSDAVVTAVSELRVVGQNMEKVLNALPTANGGDNE